MPCVPTFLIPNSEVIIPQPFLRILSTTYLKDQPPIRYYDQLSESEKISGCILSSSHFGGFDEGVSGPILHIFPQTM